MALVDERDLPEQVVKAKSMMSADERRLLYTAAKDFRSLGRIVDAGVFLGGSTISFGAALGPREFKQKPIVSYDMALVTPGMRQFFQKKGIHAALRDGDDIRRLIENNTRAYHSLIEFRFGDVLQEACDWPIEICFLDLLKTYDVNWHCVKTFFPHLVPGAIVIQQDYFYQHLPYIKVYQEYLSDYFDYLGLVRSSAVFKLKAQIPASMCEVNLYATLPAEELLALHERAERRVDALEGRSFLCALSRIELLLNIGLQSQAAVEFSALRQGYRDLLLEDAFATRVYRGFGAYHKFPR